MTKINWPLLLVLLLSSSIICAAQEQENNQGITTAEQWFELDANNHESGLLFKARWYVAPYQKVYYALNLDKDGRAFTCREVPNWASQNSHRGVLSPAQINVIKETFSNLIVYPSDQTELKEGVQRTAILYLKGEKYERVDFVGDLPLEIQRILDLVQEEIKTQEELESMRNNIP